ncbi:MAG: 3-deoxy-D-manno-octulosonic acid kinase [Colwellia sp.]
MKQADSIKVWQQDNTYCLYDSAVIIEFFPEMLSPQYWQAKRAVMGSAQGRGTTWFVRYVSNTKSEQHWVLRHYYRGGLIGKMVKDSYWFSSQKNTRAAREFDLLTYMQSLKLPAPKPIAYKVVKHGFFYQADLLSSRIEHAQDLVAILSKKAITQVLWQKIGTTIRRFHNNNIYHHDLNTHNILINEKEQVFLIDFDRGEIRDASQKSWQQANMARLQRSLNKELNRLDNFHFTNDNWQFLLKGYFDSNYAASKAS